MSDRERASVLMDGPPARVPEPVREGTALRGRRVVINDPDGVWVRDLRAADDPYLYDEEAGVRWLPGDRVPPDGNPHRARLFVAACRESDWFEWARTKRRPEVVEYPAYLVWVE